ncbi:MAG: twin-arginine translocation signal domain-containing protein [Candidatus Doudnabacteria bacterium]|nr:twin-arginine translocation signal domain-containing protein [Candidatus Doudnabacteria bacterium]
MSETRRDFLRGLGTGIAAGAGLERAARQMVDQIRFGSELTPDEQKKIKDKANEHGIDPEQLIEVVDLFQRSGQKSLKKITETVSSTKHNNDVQVSIFSKDGEIYAEFDYQP